MPESWISAIPGELKGLDDQRTDLLELLQLDKDELRVPDKMARGYSNPPLSVVKIGGSYYDATQVLGVLADRVTSTVQETTMEGSTVSITDAEAGRAKALVTTITAAQPGEGNPAPDNVRPIIGWDAISLCHGAAYDEAASPALTATLPETVWGGTLDWTTGALTVTHWVQVFDGTEEWTSPSAGTYQYNNAALYAKTASTNQDACMICSHFKADRYRSSGNADNTCYEMNNNKLMVKCASVATLEDWTAYLAAQAAAGTPLTIVWELLPQYHTTIQLTPQQLTLLKGSNAIWSDAGDTAVTYTAYGFAALEQRVAALETAVLAMGANI